MSLVRPGLAAALFFLVLIQPNHPSAMGWSALATFPLELPVILTALMAAGSGRAGIALRVVIVALLGLAVLLKLADLGTFIAFSRNFNPLSDLNLIHAAWTLAQGSFGVPLAILALAAGLVAFVALVAALWWASGIWSGYARRPGLRWGAAALLVPLAVVAVAETGQARRSWTLPPAIADSIPGRAFTARLALDRAQLFRTTLADLEDFRRAAALDPMRDVTPLFDRLQDRDLIVLYVESYGRSSFRNPLYIPTHTGRLRDIEDDLDARGLAMRSGWARAAMVGGQSWLTHGAVASGLWLNNQARYRAMLISPRRTLYHYAQEAGRRTVAIMPAHVFAWPEGDYFGFDAIYNAPDLGYRGEPFNWVTMPDQFTLEAFDRLEHGRPDRDPLVAQIALISSHAPWVPIPELVAWDEIGDGTIFNEWALSGDPPEVVWRDRDRVRDQFRQAIDYSLASVGAWAARHADDPPLMIVLGDHEPARFVSGNEDFDVPVHVIGPQELVDRFEDLGWGEGMIPDDGIPVLRMDRLRDEILLRLSTGTP